ncbi:MAG: MFS transporter [Armatimonadota bacterium]|nr:MFS transporter [Armatimonadota bacterium]
MTEPLERPAEATPGLDNFDTTASPEPHDPYAALKYRDYVLYAVGSNIATIGRQMTSLAVAWDLYVRTHQVLSLAWLGLVHGLPIILFALPAGHIADRLDRKMLVLVGQVVTLISVLGLAAVSYFQAPIALVYVCLFISSLAGAFSGPARSALLPQLLPERLLANAVTWNTSVFQVASMIGPAVGGFALEIRHGEAWPVYLMDCATQLVFFACIALVQGRRPIAGKREPVTLQSLAAGIHFVRDNRIILATITLDLFAVLLGGAVMLLPVYAKDILHVGPSGLGWLRAAPAAGALIMAAILTHRPPMQRAGLTMLCAVAGFGAATIVFGLSHSFWLSLSMLFLTGVFDNISVVVRHTLVLIMTPDEMRGRVSAVNNIFITASNDIGDFESGLVAHLLNPVLSVVTGGIGTLLVVLAVALAWPQVRRFGPLQAPTRDTKLT